MEINMTVKSQIRQGYKQTPLGELPEEWEVLKLETVILKTQYGLSIKGTSIGAYPILRMNNLFNGRISTDDLQYVDIDESVLDRFQLHRGDILFNRTNSYKLVGKTSIFHERKTYVFASYLIRVEPNTKLILPEYLNFYLNYYSTQERIKSMASRSVSQSNINAKKLKRLIISLPPIVEQRRIASILSNVDEAIQKTQQIIEQTQQIKQGLMETLLTRGIGHIRYKDSQLGEIPFVWDISTIGQECQVGTGGTPNRKVKEYYKGSIPWITTTELNYNIIYESKEYLTEKGLNESNAQIFPKGTLFIAMYGLEAKGTRGRCAILGVPSACNQACGAILASLNIDPFFIFYYYQRLGDNIMRYVCGTKRQNLTIGIIREITIPRPPMEEQRKIVKILFTLDEIKNRNNAKVSQLIRIKSGLMQVLFSGKTRVKVNT